MRSVIEGRRVRPSRPLSLCSRIGRIIRTYGECTRGTLICPEGESHSGCTWSQRRKPQVILGKMAYPKLWPWRIDLRGVGGDLLYLSMTIITHQFTSIWPLCVCFVAWGPQSPASTGCGCFLAQRSPFGGIWWQQAVWAFGLKVYTLRDILCALSTIKLSSILFPSVAVDLGCFVGSPGIV